MSDYSNFIYDKIIQTKDSININSFDLSVCNKKLFINSKLSISKSAIYGLIGKNGSGKTTLLKIISELKNSVNNSSLKINTLYVEQEFDIELFNNNSSKIQFIDIIGGNIYLYSIFNRKKVSLYSFIFKGPPNIFNICRGSAGCIDILLSGSILFFNWYIFDCLSHTLLSFTSKLYAIIQLNEQKHPYK